MPSLRNVIFAACLLAASSSFAVPPVVTVTTTEASATVTAGASTAWVCQLVGWGGSSGWISSVRDEDGDGVVRQTMPPSTYRAFCVVADLSTGELGLGSSDEAPSVHSFAAGFMLPDANGRMTTVQLPENGWMLLWMRPGSGAWVSSAPAKDLDRTQAGLFAMLSMQDMRPVATDGAAAPTELAHGDTLVAVPVHGNFLFADLLTLYFDYRAIGFVAFNVPPGSGLEIDEGSDYAMQLVRVRGTENTIPVRIRATGGTAVAGLDYGPVDTIVTFEPHELLESVSLGIVDDDIYAGTRTFDLHLEEVIGGSIEPNPRRHIRLRDNDPAPVFAVGDIPRTFRETDTPWTLEVPIVLTGKTRVMAAVSYSIPGAKVTEGTLVFQPGQRATTIPIRINADTISSDDREITVYLSNTTNATVAAAQTIIRIIDDDLPRLGGADVIGSESKRRADVTLSLDGVPKPSTSYSWSTVDGTARAGVDYIATSGTSSRTSRSITITLLDDKLTEGPETFFVEIRDTTGLQSAVSRVTVTIADDEALPFVTVENASVIEGAAGARTTARIPVRISTPPPVPVEVAVTMTAASAESGIDFSAPPHRTVTIPAGSLVGELELTVLGDDHDEPDEWIQLRVASTAYGTIPVSTSALVIRDDDAGTAPYLSVLDTRLVEGNGTTAAQFRLALAAPQSSAISVQYSTVDFTALAGSDYTATWGTVTIPPGATAATISVPIVGDGVSEPVEALQFTIYNPTGATLGQSTAEALIFDDDYPGAPLLALSDIRVVEGHDRTTSATFTLTLAQPPLQPVRVSVATVAGTATPGADFEPHASLVTFAPGEMSRIVTVRIAGDRERESDETFELRLSSPDGVELHRDRATCTIADDDDPATGRRRSARH